tara:strand:+ start:72 stop:656 length:585 start_codon:yes stop_codon:yes gene_type:complete
MDIDKIHIFDNFLPSKVEDEIEDKLRLVPFRFAKNSRTEFPKIKVKDSNLTNWNRPGLLQCWTFEHGTWNICDGIQWTEDVLKYLPFNYELQRVKVNFNPKVDISKDKCMHPHCDIRENGFTAIYYINDSDGDTIIFNEKTVDPFLQGKELSIKKRIKNKRGRLVMFNQDYLHAGMPPTISDYRAVINFNFKVL